MKLLIINWVFFPLFSFVPIHSQVRLGCGAASVGASLWRKWSPGTRTTTGRRARRMFFVLFLCSFSFSAFCSRCFFCCSCCYLPCTTLLYELRFVVAAGVGCSLNFANIALISLHKHLLL